MANNRRDVELVIKARDEATKVTRGVTDALHSLATAQTTLVRTGGNLGDSLLEVRGALGQVQSVYKTVAADADRASSAFERQQRQLAETKTAYGALATQIDEAQRRLDRLRKEPGVSKDVAGPPIRAGLKDELKVVEGAYRSLVSQASKMSSSIDQQDAALGRAQSAMQELGSTAIALSQALDGIGSEEQRRDVMAQADAFEAAAADAARYRAEIERLAAQEVARDRQRAGLRSNQAGPGISAAMKDRFDADAAAAAKYQRELDDLQRELDALEKSELKAKLDSDAKAMDAARKQAAEYRNEIERLATEEAARKNAIGLTSNQAGSGFSNALKDQMEAQALATAKAREEEDKLAASADRLRAAMNPLGAIQKVHNTELAEARRLFEAGTISADEFARAQTYLASQAKKAADAIGRGQGAGGGGKGAFLGLKPYELQNLSYQINDIFTQLASGTGITQTLAQQSGQVLQLFPKLMAAIGAGAKDPRILATVAVLATVALSIRRIMALNSDIRAFSGDLALMSDGARYSATSLALVARQLDESGFKAKEARAAVSAFVKQGLDPSQLDAFALSVKNLAKVTGLDLPTAAEKVSTAFSGGYEAISKLDDELQFLTVSERAYIRELFNQGKALEARSAAFDIFQKKAQEAADKSKGPWTDAIKDLTTAWRGFLDWVGRTGIIQNTIKELALLASGARAAAGMLPGGKADGAAGGGGISGGVERTPAWQGGGFKWNRPGWAGGDGGTPVVTKDIEALVRMAMGEASTRQGQQDVVAVALNRAASAGQTPEQIVNYPHAFESMTNPKTRAQLDAIDVTSERFRKALENILPILEGTVPDPTKGATMFFAPQLQADLGRARPKWADPSKMTAERGGHQFFTGSFPSGSGGAESDAAAKSGADLLEQAKQRYALEQKVDDQQRIRIAGEEAFRDAMNRNSDEASARQIQALAIQNETFKVETERTAQQKELTAAVSAYADKAADASGQWAATMTQLTIDQNVLIAQIDELARKGATTDTFGTPLETLKTQVRANYEILSQQERMKDWQDQINAVEAIRVDRLSVINRQYQQGTISLAEAQAQTSAINREALSNVKNVVDMSVTFAESLRTAEPSEKLETFIENMKALPSNLEKSISKLNIDLASSVGTTLAAQRDSLMQQLEAAKESGDGGAVVALQTQLQSVNAELITALMNVRAMWVAMGSGPEAQQAIAQIDATVAGLKNFSATFKITAGDISRMIAGGMTNAFDSFAKEVADGRNAWLSFRDAFRVAAADFLRQIALMIIQQMLLNALMAAGGFGGFGGGAKGAAQAAKGVASAGTTISGSIANAITAAGNNSGGGMSDIWKKISTRHDGGLAGMPGLTSKEVIHTLEKGEEILPTGDPRHQNNIGGGGGGVSVKVINTMDPSEFVSVGLNTPSGEEAVMNVISARATEIKQLIGN